MRVITKRTLREFWATHADAEGALIDCFKDAEGAHWQSFADVRTTNATASHLTNERVCFNIKGNRYRLIVAIDYDHGFVLIVWIATHAEYSKIDAATVVN